MGRVSAVKEGEEFTQRDFRATQNGATMDDSEVGKKVGKTPGGKTPGGMTEHT